MKGAVWGPSLEATAPEKLSQNGCGISSRDVEPNWLRNKKVTSCLLHWVICAKVVAMVALVAFMSLKQIAPIVLSVVVVVNVNVEIVVVVKKFIHSRNSRINTKIST